MAKSTKSSKKKAYESPLTAQHDSSSKKTKTMTTHRDDDGIPRSSQKSKKRARREEQEDLEEEKLTSLLFGDGAGGDISSALGDEDPFRSERKEVLDTSIASGTVEEADEVDPFAFQIDRTGQSEEFESDTEVAAKTTSKKCEPKHQDEEENDSSVNSEDDHEGDAPAWEDPDDGAATKLVDASYRLRKLRRSREEKQALSSHELEQRLRERYEDTAQGAARTDWAKTSQILDDKRRLGSDDDTDDEEDSDDEALTLFDTSKSLLASSRNRLPPNILNIIRCPDANQADPNNAVVRAVNFHPGSDPEQPLMLTAGLDKNLRFFQIGEEKSTKIHGIHCKFFFHVLCCCIVFN